MVQVLCRYEFVTVVKLILQLANCDVIVDNNDVIVEHWTQLDHWPVGEQGQQGWAHCLGK